MSHSTTNVDPRRVRIIALAMFILGIPSALILTPSALASLKILTPTANFLFIGLAIGILWLVRFAFANLSRKFRAFIWIASTIWHASLLPLLMLYFFHPLLLYIGIYHFGVFGFSIKLILDDNAPCAKSP